MDHNKKLTEELLALADVKVNGTRPWDIQVHDELFYSRVLKDRSLGLGESYMDGWWECERVDEFFLPYCNSGSGIQNQSRYKNSEQASCSYDIESATQKEGIPDRRAALRYW